MRKGVFVVAAVIEKPIVCRCCVCRADRVGNRTNNPPVCLAVASFTAMRAYKQISLVEICGSIQVLECIKMNFQQFHA